MTNKQKYRELCKTEASIPIFSKDWWLDAVCGEKRWDVALVEKGGTVIASMPYYMKTILQFNIITMPKLTQTMGPWIKYPPDQQYAKRISYEKMVMYELINNMPKFDCFDQNCHYSITNWLPFYWKGFSQTTRYTYVIEDLSSLQRVFSEFHRSKKRNVKKAKKMVKVNFDLPAKDFYDHHKMTLAKQSEKILYSFPLFKRIYDSCYKYKCGKTIYAMDNSGNVHSALFVVWYDSSAYDLISTIDPGFKNSGSATLLVKEMIEYVAQYTKKFDFEGSMIENVENSFRQFATRQVPYFQITKINSPLFKVCRDVRSWTKMITSRRTNKWE